MKIDHLCANCPFRRIDFLSLLNCQLIDLLLYAFGKFLDALEELAEFKNWSDLYLSRCLSFRHFLETGR